MRLSSLAFLILAVLTGLSALSSRALAVEAVRVGLDAPAIDLTPMIERYRSDGDLIQIATAPGKDGIVRLAFEQRGAAMPARGRTGWSSR